MTAALDLYALLPAVYRARDEDQRYLLRALLAIIEKQAGLLKGNIEELWDDFFVETCQSWVVPYLGDLVGTTPIHDVGRGRRADVAKTIRYRRRKGTLPVLDEVSADVTGWGAHSVAFFDELGWTQNVNHVRWEPPAEDLGRPLDVTDRVASVDVRNRDALDWLDGPFDPLAHTVDVRPIGQRRGRHNIRNVGIFVWRLQAFPLAGVPPRQVEGEPRRFHFNTIGAPAPLFQAPARKRDDLAEATEANVSGPIRPLAFEHAPGRFYGHGKSVAVYRGNVAEPSRLVPVDHIVPMDLARWAEPPATKVGVDVRRGRLHLGTDVDLSQGITVSYSYGFPGELGGGPYERRDSLADDTQIPVLHVSKQGPLTTLQDAMALWDPSQAPRMIFRILDNGIYGGNLGTPVDVDLPPRGQLIIEAANGARPTIRPVGRIRVLAPAEGASFVLNGLVLEGGLDLGGNVALSVLHSTLVPGKKTDEHGNPSEPNLDSIVVDGMGATPGPAHDRLEVLLDHAITGPLRIPAECRGIVARHTIVQATPLTPPGPPGLAIAGHDDGSPAARTTLERCTIFGSSNLTHLDLASEVIFVGPVRCERRQGGCVRFSYLPAGSIAPSRYRCEPDEEIERGVAAVEREAAARGVAMSEREVGRARARIRRRVLGWLAPAFTSTRHGQPGFAQLHVYGPAPIRTGAEDGAELGAFHELQEVKREANLRMRLEEYLPVGLDAGPIYVETGEGTYDER